VEKIVNEVEDQETRTINTDSMKTKSKTTLQFSKDSITELSDPQIHGIKGGCQWSNSSGFTKITKISIIGNPSVVTTDDILG